MNTLEQVVEKVQQIVRGRKQKSPILSLQKHMPYIKVVAAATSIYNLFNVLKAFLKKALEKIDPILRDFWGVRKKIKGQCILKFGLVA